MRSNLQMAATLTLLTAGCIESTSATVTPYEDAYLYATYYPDTITYAAYGWADDWGTSAVVLAPASATPVVSDAGPTARLGRPHGAGLAGAIQALASGRTVCPGQVSIATKTAAPACSGASARCRSQRRDADVHRLSVGHRDHRRRRRSDLQPFGVGRGLCAATTTIMLRATLDLDGRRRSARRWADASSSRRNR